MKEEDINMYSIYIYREREKQAMEFTLPAMLELFKSVARFNKVQGAWISLYSCCPIIYSFLDWWDSIPIHRLKSFFMHHIVQILVGHFYSLSTSRRTLLKRFYCHLDW
jgi:hypothetical protein